MVTALVFAVAIGVLREAQGKMEAPESLLAAASADPTTFVSILTHVGIPAGLEIRQSTYDQYANRSRQWDPEQWTAARLAQRGVVPLAQIVTTFNQRHTEYKAAILSGVLVIRPVDRRVAYLDG